MGRLTSYRKLELKLASLDATVCTDVSLKEPGPRALQAIDLDVTSREASM